ncbi:hypothetical protein [Paraburkholderia sp. RL17-373-BIF-A]|uniref:hypothetical protein n=1 Tax=Paraburkholderia sp. RL17-373-BIF-A TaxID=3031629 RepID=UPI0038BD3819
MNAHIFNICLLIGWLLSLAGGVLLNLGGGMIFAGLLLLAIVLVVTRMVGIYVPKREEKDAD